MLNIIGLSKKLGDFSLEDISFKVEKADYFVLLGESGAGKSVILELIAGMEKPDSGVIYLNGKDITNHAIQQRGINMVFQDFAIFPHLSVAENITYSLKSRSVSKDEIKNRLAILADEMEISSLLDRKPKGLSGGELQRVALARALAAEPKLLLLDEPLAAVDILLKDQLRSLLRHLNKKGITIIHVTHDFDEALSLANKIAFVHKGRLIRTGTPDEIFHAPDHPFIARFVGIQNFFPAIIKSNGEESNRQAVLQSGRCIEIISNLDLGKGFVVIPSDEIIIAEEKQASSASNCIEGHIKDIIPSIKGIDIIVDCGDFFHVTITRKSLERLQLEKGKRIWISWKALSGKFISN
ncbi:MAG: ABC transporter ATP-binding protein [Bacteroidales bacterium]